MYIYNDRLWNMADVEQFPKDKFMFKSTKVHCFLLELYWKHQN